MAILTDVQLEIAARKFCELTGMDPYKMVQCSSPTDSRGYTYDVYMEQEYWKSVAEKIKLHNLIVEAMRHAEKHDGSGVSNEPS